MTSERRLRANRANARASTGPQSATGKKRASQNARRHGLSLSVGLDPILSERAKSLAREIAGEGATSEILGLASRVADAEIDILRVRQARLELRSQDDDFDDSQTEGNQGIDLKALRSQIEMPDFDPTPYVEYVL